jgi:hypothetical protein
VPGGSIQISSFLPPFTPSGGHFLSFLQKTMSLFWESFISFSFGHIFQQTEPGNMSLQALLGGGKEGAEGYSMG